MRQLLWTEPTISPLELLEMATVNAAAALRRQHSLGRIRSGFIADLIAVPADGKRGEVLANVVAFDDQVPWEMVDARVLELA